MASLRNDDVIPFNSIPAATEFAFSRIHPDAPNTNFLPPSGILEPSVDLNYATGLSITTPPVSIPHQPLHHARNDSTPLSSSHQAALFNPVPQLFPGITQQSNARLIQPSRTLFPPQSAHYVQTFTQTGVGVGVSADQQPHAPAFSLPSLATEKLRPADLHNSFLPTTTPPITPVNPISLINPPESSAPIVLDAELQRQYTNNTAVESVTNTQHELFSQLLSSFETELSPSFDNTEYEKHFNRLEAMDYVNGDEDRYRTSHHTLNRTQLDEHDDIDDALFEVSYINSPNDDQSETGQDLNKEPIQYRHLKEHLQEFNFFPRTEIISPQDHINQHSPPPPTHPTHGAEKFRSSYPQFLYQRAKELYQSSSLASLRAKTANSTSSLFNYLHDTDLFNLFPTTDQSAAQWAYSPFHDFDTARTHIDALITALSQPLGIESIPILSFDAQVTFLSLWNTGIWVPSKDYPIDLLQSHYYVIPPAPTTTTTNYRTLLTQHDDLSPYPVMMVYSPFNSPRYFAITDYSWIEINPARHSHARHIHNFITPVHNTVSRAIFHDTCIYRPDRITITAQPSPNTTQQTAQIYLQPITIPSSENQNSPENDSSREGAQASNQSSTTATPTDQDSNLNPFLLPKLQVLHELHAAIETIRSEEQTPQRQPASVRKRLNALCSKIGFILKQTASPTSPTHYHLSVDLPQSVLQPLPPLSHSCVLFVATMLKQVDMTINNMLSAMATENAKHAINNLSEFSTYRTPLIPQAHIITPPDVGFAYQHPYTPQTLAMLEKFQHMQFHAPTALSPYVSSKFQLNPNAKSQDAATSTTLYLLYVHSKHAEPLHSNNQISAPTFITTSTTMREFAQNKDNQLGDPFQALLASFVPITAQTAAPSTSPPAGTTPSSRRSKAITEFNQLQSTHERSHFKALNKVAQQNTAQTMHFNNTLLASCIPYDLLATLIRSELRQTAIFRETNNDYKQVYGAALRLPDDIQMRYLQSQFLFSLRATHIPLSHQIQTVLQQNREEDQSQTQTQTQLEHHDSMNNKKNKKKKKEGKLDIQERPAIISSLLNSSQYAVPLVTPHPPTPHVYGIEQSYTINNPHNQSSSMNSDPIHPFSTTRTGFTSHAYSYLHVNGPNNRAISFSLVTTPNTEPQTQLLHETSNQAEVIGMSQPLIDPIHQIIPTKSTYEIDHFLRIVTRKPWSGLPNAKDKDEIAMQNHDRDHCLKDIDILSLGDTLSTRIYARSTRQCILFNVKVKNMINAQPHISSLTRNTSTLPADVVLESNPTPFHRTTNTKGNTIRKTNEGGEEEVFLPTWMPHAEFNPIAELITPVPILDFQINPVNINESALLLKDGRINFWDLSNYSSSPSPIDHQYHGEYTPGPNIPPSPISTRSIRNHWEDCNLIDLWWLGTTERQLDILSQLHPVNDYNMYMYRHGLYFNPVFDNVNRLYYLQQTQSKRNDPNPPHFHVPLPTLTRPPFPTWGKLQYSHNPAVLFGALPHSLWNIDRRVSNFKTHSLGTSFTPNLIQSPSSPIPLRLLKDDIRIFDVKIDHEYNPYHLALSTAAHVYLYDTRNFSNPAAQWPIPSVPTAAKSFTERSFAVRTFDNRVTPEIRQLSFTHTQDKLVQSPSNPTFHTGDNALLDTIPVPQSLTTIQPTHTPPSTSPISNLLNTATTPIVGYTTKIPPHYLSSHRLINKSTHPNLTIVTQTDIRPKQTQTTHKLVNSTFLLQPFARSFIHISAFHQPRQWLLEYITIAQQDPPGKTPPQLPITINQSNRYNTLVKAAGKPIPLHIPVINTAPHIDDYVNSYKPTVDAARIRSKRKSAMRYAIKAGPEGIWRRADRNKNWLRQKISRAVANVIKTGAAAEPMSSHQPQHAQQTQQPSPSFDQPPPQLSLSQVGSSIRSTSSILSHSPLSTHSKPNTLLAQSTSNSLTSSRFRPFSIKSITPTPPTPIALSTPPSKVKAQPQQAQLALPPRNKRARTLPSPYLNAIPFKFHSRTSKKHFRVFASNKYPIDPLLQRSYNSPAFHTKSVTSPLTLASTTYNAQGSLPKFTNNDSLALDPAVIRAELSMFQASRDNYRSKRLRNDILQVPDSDPILTHAMYHNKLRLVQQQAKHYKKHLLQACFSLINQSHSISSKKKAIGSLDSFIPPKISQEGLLPRTNVPTTKILTPKQRSKLLARPPFTITTTPILFPQRIPFTYIPIALNILVPQDIYNQFAETANHDSSPDASNTLFLTTAQYEIIRIPTVIYDLISNHIFQRPIEPASTQLIPLRPYNLCPILSTTSISFHSHVKQAIHFLQPHLSLQPQTIYIEFNMLYAMTSMLFRPLLHQARSFKSAPRVTFASTKFTPAALISIPTLYSLNDGSILDPEVNLISDCIDKFEQGSVAPSKTVKLQAVPKKMLDLTPLAELLLFSFVQAPTQQYQNQKRPWLIHQITPKPLYHWPQLISQFDNMIDLSTTNTPAELLQTIQQRFQPLLSDISLLKMIHYINSISVDLVYTLQSPRTFTELIAFIYNKIQSSLLHFNTTTYFSTPRNTQSSFLPTLFETIPPQFLQLELQLSNRLVSKWLTQHSSAHTSCILPFFDPQSAPNSINQAYLHYYSTPATLIFNALRLFSTTTAFSHLCPPPPVHRHRQKHQATHAYVQIHAYHLRHAHLADNIKDIYKATYPNRDFTAITAPLPIPFFDLYFRRAPFPPGDSILQTGINYHLNPSTNTSCLCPSQPHLLKHAQQLFPQHLHAKPPNSYILQCFDLPQLCPMPSCSTMTMGLFTSSIPTLPSQSLYQAKLTPTAQTAAQQNPSTSKGQKQTLPATQVLSTAPRSSDSFGSFGSFGTAPSTSKATQTTQIASLTQKFSLEASGSMGLLATFTDRHVDSIQESNSLVFNTLLADDNWDEFFADIDLEKPPAPQTQPQNPTIPQFPTEVAANPLFTPGFQPGFELKVPSFLPKTPISPFDIAHPSKSFIDYSTSQIQASKSMNNIPTHNSFETYCQNSHCSPFQLGINGIDLPDASASVMIDSLTTHFLGLEQLAFELLE